MSICLFCCILCRPALELQSYTYIHNEKVQPTPSVGEVGLETICNPFQEHLNDKNVGENLVCKLKNYFDGSSPFYVYIFKGLQKKEEKKVKCLRNNFELVVVITGLTRAPLLRRIMKMMKVSNQSCSTMVKQVFLRFHHFLPLSLVVSTVKHGHLVTQSVKKEKAPLG